MNDEMDEEIKTIESAVLPRIDALIKKEGDLGRLAFAVINAKRCVSLLLTHTTLPLVEAIIASEMIVEALVLSIRTENTETFPAVHEAASKIMEDAEKALNNSASIKGAVNEIIKRMAGK